MGEIQQAKPAGLWQFVPSLLSVRASPHGTIGKQRKHNLTRNDCSTVRPPSTVEVPEQATNRVQVVGRIPAADGVQLPASCRAHVAPALHAHGSHLQSVCGKSPMKQ